MRISWDKKHWDQFISAILLMPRNEDVLDLSWNCLGDKTGAELATAFQSIPPNVTTLNLSQSFLGHRKGTELATAFQAIPPGVTTLDLSGDFLGHRKGTELATAFQSIPPTVTTLNLSKNDFGFNKGTDSATAFQAIPATVTTLNLSGNYFGFNKGTNSATAFQAIPATVTTLNLSGNYFGFTGFTTGAELATTFQGIPPNVTTLDLSANSLCDRTGAELATAFQGILPNVTTLNLSENNLYQKTGAELVTAFQSIPPTVTTLNLSGNDLGNKTGTELATLFQAIPSHIQSIDLSSNHLDRLDPAELKKALAKIPSHIKSVSLTQNRFFAQLSIPEADAQFKALQQAKPPTVTLNLAYNGLSQMYHLYLPRFLRTRSSFFGKLNQDVIGLIFDFLAPERIKINAEKIGTTALSVLRIQQDPIAYKELSAADIAPYLLSNPTLARLQKLKDDYEKNENPDSITHALTIFTCLALLESKISKCDQIKTLKDLTIEYLIFEDKALKTKFTNAFKALEKEVPHTCRSIIITLAIAATLIGLLFLAAHALYTGRFFVGNQTIPALKPIKTSIELMFQSEEPPAGCEPIGTP